MKKIMLLVLSLIPILANCQSQDTVAKIDSSELTEGKIYKATEVDKPAFYPGGKYKMLEFIAVNLMYPLLSEEEWKQGTVYVKLIIEKDSSTSNHEVIKSFGDKYCNAESIRVAKKMWFIPAKLNNEYVRSEMVVPMRFIVEPKRPVE